ncbi:MAG: putative manganese-dependent inorganic diphosphatase [Erysipelotrichaceae bacterium]|nr:putative manganese-dependent inorganic diphosphatase [Erysipelotrichaceae bacterium]
MKVSDMIYITGHKHPDSDSIVSAIAYAQLKNRQGEAASACRLGECNDETKYLLKRFGFEEPMLFEDARATLAEIEMDDPITISPEATLHETLYQMDCSGKRSLGVVNRKNQLLGMVTKSDLATIGLGDTALSIRLLRETPIANIAKTISGQLVYDDPNLHFNGKVSIIAIAETRLKNYDLKDRLVMVGDDTDAQLAAIRKGAGVLIIVWASDVENEVIEQAKRAHCPIIISGHGTMNTSRYLFFAPPVKLIMQKKLISFNANDLVQDAEKKMMKTRYRSYPVVDDENRIQGYVSRYHILNSHNKKVILVDHNEYAQSVKGIEDAELLEVIDHHRIGDIFTSRPISFRNEIIGSTATIIASMFMENQMQISKELAGLLLGAILSDTLKFRSPTATLKDQGVASALAKIADLDIDQFAKELFQVTSNLRGKTMRELIQQDIKRFDIDDHPVMVSQIIALELDEVRDIKTALREEMEQIVKERGLDLLVVAFTSILENGSVFFGAGVWCSVVKEAFPWKENDPFTLQEDILSRKNQIVPMLTRAIINH